MVEITREEVVIGIISESYSGSWLGERRYNLRITCSQCGWLRNGTNLTRESIKRRKGPDMEALSVHWTIKHENQEQPR